MNAKFLIFPGVIFGLGMLFSITGQSEAATFNAGNYNKQPFSLEFNFVDDIFVRKPVVCGGCEYRIPERPYYVTLLPVYPEGLKYTIPEKPYYGSYSPIDLIGYFGVDHDESAQPFKTRFASHESSEFQQSWNNSIIKPRTIFKDKDGWTDNRWAHHDHDEELNSGLTDWDDGSHVSPVPESDEWALMLAGFSVIGFIIYRRKRNEISSANKAQCPN